MMSRLTDRKYRTVEYSKESAHHCGPLSNLKRKQIYDDLDDDLSGRSGGPDTMIYSTVGMSVPMNNVITKSIHIDQSSERV